MPAGALLEAGSEVVDSGAVLVSAQACVECLEYVGVDPSLAGPLAVLLAFAGRMAFAWWQTRSRNRQARAEAAKPVLDADSQV